MRTPVKNTSSKRNGDSSPYENLQDPVTPSGRLTDRIQLLKRRCVEALGKRSFTDAYNFLKENQDVSIFHK